MEGGPTALAFRVVDPGKMGDLTSSLMIPALPFLVLIVSHETTVSPSFFFTSDWAALPSRLDIDPLLLSSYPRSVSSSKL